MGSLGLARYCASIIVIAVLVVATSSLFSTGADNGVHTDGAYSARYNSFFFSFFFNSARITNKLKIVRCHVVASRVTQ